MKAEEKKSRIDELLEIVPQHLIHIYQIKALNGQWLRGMNARYKWLENQLETCRRYESIAQNTILIAIIVRQIYMWNKAGFHWHTNDLVFSGWIMVYAVIVIIQFFVNGMINRKMKPFAKRFKEFEFTLAKLTPHPVGLISARDFTKKSICDFVVDSACDLLVKERRFEELKALKNWPSPVNQIVRAAIIAQAQEAKSQFEEIWAIAVWFEIFSSSDDKRNVFLKATSLLDGESFRVR